MKLTFEVDTDSDNYYEDLRQVTIISSAHKVLSCLEDMLSHFRTLEDTDMSEKEFAMVSRIREELGNIVSEYGLFDLLY